MRLGWKSLRMRSAEIWHSLCTYIGYISYLPRFRSPPTLIVVYQKYHECREVFLIRVVGKWGGEKGEFAWRGNNERVWQWPDYRLHRPFEPYLVLRELKVHERLRNIADENGEEEMAMVGWVWIFFFVLRGPTLAGSCTTVAVHGKQREK